jgi:hypothetical protein
MGLKMKIVAKIILVVAILSTVFALSFVASAATKDEIISVLKAGNIKATYIAMASDYLKSNTFTTAQLDAGLANVNSAIALMNTENQTDVLKLNATARASLINIVNKTSAETGITVTSGKDTSGVTFLKISTTNGTPYVISESDLALKVTGGNDYASFIMLSVGIILMALGSAFIIARKATVKA